jgi:hypothetical protein
LKPSSLITMLVVLVLTWTGTFLHDIDELGFDFGLSSHDVEEPAPHLGHFHGSTHDGEPIIAGAQMHGHDPSVLPNARNDQSNSSESTSGLIGFESVDLPGMPAALCVACRERPPPRNRKIPSYLLYHAMLI